MMILPFSIDCPVCAATQNERCMDMDEWVKNPHHPVYLPNPHGARVEAAAFLNSLAQPARDRAPITDAEILGTGEV